MIETRGINHIAITVSDLDASRRFYEEIIGLKPVDRPPLSFGGAWYAVGSQELHLMHDPDLQYGNREHAHAAIEVADVDAALAELQSKGVVIRRGPVRRADGVKQFFFADPDGYMLEMFSHE